MLIKLYKQAVFQWGERLFQTNNHFILALFAFYYAVKTSVVDIHKSTNFYKGNPPPPNFQKIMTISQIIENKIKFITAWGIQVAELLKLFIETFCSRFFSNNISLTISYSSEIFMHINTNKAMIKHIEYFCTLNNNFIRDL